MRLLLIEDEFTFAEGLVPRLERAGADNTVTLARSRDSAITALEREFFDIVILDLRIPTLDEGTDDAVEHGYSVFGRAQQLAPGTPIYILTASSAEPLVHDLLKHARQEDIWGSRVPVGTVASPSEDTSTGVSPRDFRDCQSRRDNGPDRDCVWSSSCFAQTRGA